ncbi:MAG TPA: TonB-dependent receptor [Steroidobacteraceae bacterium]
MPPGIRSSLLVLGTSLAGAGAPVLAQSTGAATSAPSAPTELGTVVVTATRAPQSSAELPVSIDRIDEPQITQGQLQVNLSETLDMVPGVSAQNRQNYAQDLQLSIRGFGARSQFGVRGVRLYSDGIPGTMPDGQGQFSNFDLSSADRIEVLRGPFSALYGNSSGGVIALFTEDGKPGCQLQGTVLAGSLDTQRFALKGSGDTGSVNYVIDATHFQTDGYRQHSEAERNIFNGKVRFKLDDVSKLTLVANAIATPFIQDPLGLTRAQLAADPTQAGVNALAYNSRKDLNQEQLGAIYERELGSDDDLQATLYGGHRATTQFQAIPASAETASYNPGGVINLNRLFGGLDVHVTDRRTLLGGPLQSTAGISYDNLQEARKGFTNFVGTDLGVEGVLRRDESNRVFDFDQYLQVQWDPTERLRAMVGVRQNLVQVRSHDLLELTGNPDSGVRYAATDPVAGISFRAAPQLHVYGSYGKGFETPTLNDLSYRSTDGSIPGLNLGLKAARSDDFEVGLKAGQAPLRADLAAFYITTRDELAVQSNAAGRSVYENIGQTERRGLEAGLDADWRGGFSGRLAYTYLNAVTAQPYQTCIGVPCQPMIIAAGSHLPAVPEDSLYAGLTWSYVPRGFSATLETVSRAQIYADDRNSQAAAGYTIANLRFGLEQHTRGYHLSEFARIDNLTNRNYVGSVIVNETNSRYFEPDPGRTFDLMFTIAHAD